RVRHTMGIVDVHLAAVGLDVELARSGHAVQVIRLSPVISKASSRADGRHHWGCWQPPHIGFWAQREMTRPDVWPGCFEQVRIGTMKRAQFGGLMLAFSIRGASASRSLRAKSANAWPDSPENSTVNASSRLRTSGS